MKALRGIFVIALLAAACGLRTSPSLDGGLDGGAAGGAAAGGDAGGTAGGSGGSGGGSGCSDAGDCQGPPGTVGACTNGACTFSCAPPLLGCGGGCCPIVAVSAGGEHTCALSDGGVVLCWGAAFVIGDGSFLQRLTPAVVQGLGEPAVAISAGGLVSCALTASGAVKCWGTAALGNGGGGPSPQAVQVAGIASGATSVSVGGTHACAVVDGGARCWGSDVLGEQGCGACGMRMTPGDVTGLVSDVKQVASGISHGCALLEDGGVWCWGYNASGECGDFSPGMRRNAPVRAFAFDAGVETLYAGFGFTCGRSGTDVRCVGINGTGELGVGIVSGRQLAATPVRLTSGLTAFAPGPIARHACAVMDGGAWCWGQNTRGQLGDGLMVAKNAPVPVQGLAEPVVAVAVGEEHSCAVTVSGGVWCWGSNTKGQLGNGTMGANALAPVQVR